MKKAIYESFIRLHLTYCLTVWGANKSQSITELNKLVKMSLTKIGMRKQDTNDRLRDHKILKLEDKIRIRKEKKN